MDGQDALFGLLGGGLIGLASAFFMLMNGRILGISGILGGTLKGPLAERGWRATLILGLIAGGAVLVLVNPALFAVEIDRSVGAVIAAGLLVGFGTRLGSGCTSGHGVCGISRLSPRSLVATGVFMGAGAVTVFVVQHVLGGSL